MKIEFDGDFPKYFISLFEDLLNKTHWLCPLWCQKIGVTWNSDDTTNVLECRLFKDYRTMRLVVSPAFFDYSEWEQFEQVIHEIIHCFTIPMKTVCFDAMEDLEVEEKLKIIIQRQINNVMEQVTQDFAYVIARKELNDYL